jgi:hypothetical protein
VQLLYHLRIAREAAWVKLLHLLHQILNLAQCRRIVLRRLTKLVQLLHSLTDDPLGVRRIESVIGSVRATSRLVELIVPRIHVVGNDAASTTLRIAVPYVSTFAVLPIATSDTSLSALTPALPISLLTSSLCSSTLLSSLSVSLLASSL